MKVVAYIVASIFGLAALVAVIGLITTGSVFFQAEIAKITNPGRVQQKIYDPNNTVTQVAFFHNTCNTAAAQLRIVENNQARLAADQVAARSATDLIAQRQANSVLAQDEIDVAGAQNALQTTAADYNSRSAQYTANVFKDAGLPERITVPIPIPPGFSLNCG